MQAPSSKSLLRSKRSGGKGAIRELGVSKVAFPRGSLSEPIGFLVDSLWMLEGESAAPLWGPAFEASPTRCWVLRDEDFYVPNQNSDRLRKALNSKAILDTTPALSLAPFQPAAVRLRHSEMVVLPCAVSSEMRWTQRGCESNRTLQKQMRGWNRLSLTTVRKMGPTRLCLSARTEDCDLATNASGFSCVLKLS